MSARLKRALTALGVVGGVTVAGILFNLDGAGAQARTQDRETVRLMTAAANGARTTDGGENILDALGTLCLAARDALLEAEAEHFRGGRSMDAERADEAAKCGAMLAQRDAERADDKALQLARRVYWCKHEARGCPPDGGAE